MKIAFYIKLYALTVPVFFIFDLIWLGVLAKGFYQKNLNALLSPKVNWPAAISFYLIFIAGILVFCRHTRSRQRLLAACCLVGSAFRFFHVYDL